jgi:hypothetical protein
MFDDVVIYKYDSSGVSAEQCFVPITFGPIEKAEQKRTENHYFDTTATDINSYTQVTENNVNYYISLPRMALILNSIDYNAERAYGVNEWRYWLKESLDLSGVNVDQVFADYQPTPYDLNFTLHVYTDSMSYFAQLMENILPYFNPKLFLRVKEFSFLNIDRDLPVSLTNVTPDFIDDIDANGKRYVNATIGFKVEAFLYRPWTTSKIIKVINTRYFVNTVTIPTSATSAFTDGAILVEGFSTSGYATSGGQMDVSATPPTSYNFSGTYNADNKEFNWYKDVITP